MSTGSGNGLALEGQQTITWTSSDLGQEHILASPNLTEFYNSKMLVTYETGIIPGTFQYERLHVPLAEMYEHALHMKHVITKVMK